MTSHYKFSIYDITLQAPTELAGNENIRNNRRISGKTRGYNPFPPLPPPRAFSPSRDSLEKIAGRRPR